MKIYTITLCPAYDIHAYTENFKPCFENLARLLSRDAGGKGVNISRALLNSGVLNKAIVVLGKDNCAEFRRELDTAGLDCIYFEREGRIRENLTLHDKDGNETRISFSGFSADEGLLDKISSVITADEDTVITLSGRLPDGISVLSAINFLSGFKKKGAKIVLDSKSFSMEDVLKVSPWLIKPNEEEISEYLGKKVDSLSSAAAAAKVFLDSGIDNVMVSLGDKGALVLNRNGCFTATPPDIQAISTIGAGDSTIAGFIAAIDKQQPLEECLRTAVAFGTAACLTNGSQPPSKQKICEIYNKVSVSKI